MLVKRKTFIFEPPAKFPSDKLISLEVRLVDTCVLVGSNVAIKIGQR